MKTTRCSDRYNRIKTLLLLILSLLMLSRCTSVNEKKSPESAGNQPEARKITILSENWRFQPDIRDIGEKNSWYSNSFNKESWTKVTVPEAWDCYETAMWGYEGIGWYTVTLDPADIASGNRTEIVFNRVMYYSKLWLNGEFVGENIGGYLPFSFDITRFLKAGQKNELVLRVDNRPKIEWLPAAQQIEWIQYGGIVQKVLLISTSHTFIKDFTARTDLSESAAVLNCKVDVSNETEFTSGNEIEIEISNGSDILKKTGKLVCNAKSDTACIININVDNPRLWSPETPVLYNAKVKLYKDGKLIDDITERIGLRKISAEGNSILLNGKPVILKGVNRYDEFGRFGANVPEDLLRKELSLMKSVGINTIRVHYPQSPDLLSLYDEYGFMMLEEVPINWWGQNWWGEKKVTMSPDILNYAKPALRTMVKRDKNHPCVIIWSMGNENQTDTEVGIKVMRELLKMAKSLDPTRLVTFVVALDPTGHLAYDEADIVSINKYNGSLAGKLCEKISDIDSLGYYPLVRDLELHRKSFTSKPIIITEFGTQGIKGMHGDAPYTEEFQAAYIERIWEGITSVPGISGGTLWCWADYFHRKYLITYTDYGPYGVVTVDRKPKKSLESLARMYGGSIPK